MMPDAVNRAGKEPSPSTVSRSLVDNSNPVTCRGVQLPAAPERLRAWLMERKLDKLRQDDNKAEVGRRSSIMIMMMS